MAERVYLDPDAQTKSLFVQQGLSTNTLSPRHTNQDPIIMSSKDIEAQTNASTLATLSNNELSARTRLLCSKSIRSQPTKQDSDILVEGCGVFAVGTNIASRLCTRQNAYKAALKGN